MTIVLISGLATATILTAVETFIKPLGRWRGLLTLVVSILTCLNLGAELSKLIVYALASSFIGLTLSTSVELLFSGPTTARQARGLPNKVPPL